MRSNVAYALSRAVDWDEKYISRDSCWLLVGRARYSYEKPLLPWSTRLYISS